MSLYLPSCSFRSRSLLAQCAFPGTCGSWETVVNDVEWQRLNSSSGKSFSGTNWSSKDCNGAGSRPPSPIPTPRLVSLERGVFFSYRFPAFNPKDGWWLRTLEWCLSSHWVLSGFKSLGWERWQCCWLRKGRGWKAPCIAHISDFLILAVYQDHLGNLAPVYTQLSKCLKPPWWFWCTARVENYCSG